MRRKTACIECGAEVGKANLVDGICESCAIGTASPIEPDFWNNRGRYHASLKTQLVKGE